MIELYRILEGRRTYFPETYESYQQQNELIEFPAKIWHVIYYNRTNPERPKSTNTSRFKKSSVLNMQRDITPKSTRNIKEAMFLKSRSVFLRKNILPKNPKRDPLSSLFQKTFQAKNFGSL